MKCSSNYNWAVSKNNCSACLHLAFICVCNYVNVSWKDELAEWMRWDGLINCRHNVIIIISFPFTSKLLLVFFHLCFFSHLLAKTFSWHFPRLLSSGRSLNSLCASFPKQLLCIQADMEVKMMSVYYGGGGFELNVSTAFCLSLSDNNVEVKRRSCE